MRKNSGLRQGLSIAFRFGIEMTVATGLGGLMGYAADHYLNTRPWFMVLGVFLGGGAGVLNVYRAAQSLTFDDGEGDDSSPKDE